MKETCQAGAMTSIPEIDCTQPVELLVRPGLPEQYHLFDEESAQAVRAALAAMRPLLVRGEPGVGKTQLAAAAARVFGRPLVAKVVDSRTESRDLMWEFDAVLRLADAQVAAALPAAAVGQGQGQGAAGESDSAVRKRLRNRLRIANYVRPGPLWWAFDWESAREQARRTRTPVPPLGPNADPRRGCVVLLDEIDKADTDVPNGLLEALGSGTFTPLGRSTPVLGQDQPPLVVITTNEERVLPNAFVRRCLILDLKLPDGDDRLVDHLVARAAAHFPRQEKETGSREVFHAAAELLVKDRRDARNANAAPLPGQAEYLDLLRAVFRLAPGDAGLQQQRLQEIARFVTRKFEQI
jgi:MoxR-like ATPase